MSKRASRHAKPDGQMGQPAKARGLGVLSLAVAVGIAALYAWGLNGAHPAGGSRLELFPLVALGIWAACEQPVSLRNRRGSISLALSEIPALVGIVFLPPPYVLGAVAFGFAARAVHHRLPPSKALANLVVNVAGAAVGTWAFDRLLGGRSPISPRGWLVAIGTVALVNAVSTTLLVGMAIITRMGRPRVVPVIVQLAATVALCSAGGLVALCLVSVNTWGILLFIAITVAANMAYRQTVLSGQRYANLEKLYELTRRLGTLTEGRDVMTTVLEEARGLLAATRAELVVPLAPALGGIATRCTLKGEEEPLLQVVSSPTELDQFAFSRGASLLDAGAARADAAIASVMMDRGLKEAMVAPLQRDDPGAGYLMVADRAFNHSGFGRSDLRFFEALAANAGVSLRSSKLLEQLRAEATERQQQAQHDALTGLPNRLLFSERLEEALRLSRPGDRLAVMIIDLDGFKDVNDTLGHHTGDAILGEVAARLAPLAQGADMVARLGGDEFAFLLSRAPSDDHIAALAEQLIATINRPLAVEGLLLDVRASLGVSVSPQHSQDPSSLMRQADIAMYAAKSAGGGCRFYDKAEDRSTLRRLRLATELRRAMEEDDLDVWYQPVVSLETGDVVGCEALLRWGHDQFGPISPVEFIPVAESAGLIDQLTFWVLEKALLQAKRWRELVPGLTIAVNLSARTVMSMDIPARVGRVLEQVGIEPGALTLELTESSTLADPIGSQHVLQGLRDLGVNLSIDDYGTGFSSLSRLKSLPFDELKIDKSFVKEMTHDKGDEAIVRSTIELARYLGRNVTAEGVEDQATLQALEALGCHSAQGFFLARPLPAHQCEGWLVAASAAIGNTRRVPRLGAQAARPPRQQRLPRNGGAL